MNKKIIKNRIIKNIIGLIVTFVVLVCSFPESANSATVDSDMSSFHIRIAPSETIDLGKYLKSTNDSKDNGRIVFSTKLGTKGDYFGPSVINTETLKYYGAKKVSFVIDEEGKKELKNLGYTINGEIPNLTSIDSKNFPKVPGPQVTGTSIKPGRANFTGTMTYGQNGKMVLPMQIKVLPKFFITKEIESDSGVEIPAKTYTFSFTPKNSSDSSIPKLDDVKISYDENATGIKSSDDLTDIIASKFTKPGVYTYILKDSTSRTSCISGVESSNSSAEYEITFTLENNPNKTTENSAGKVNKLRVLSVTAKKIKNEDGTSVNGAELDNYYQTGANNTIRFTRNIYKLPILSVANATIKQNEQLDLKSLILCAKDYAGNDLKSSVQITSSGFDNSKVGNYTVRFTVSDSRGKSSVASATVNVLKSDPTPSDSVPDPTKKPASDANQIPIILPTANPGSILAPKSVPLMLMSPKMVESESAEPEAEHAEAEHAEAENKPVKEQKSKQAAVHALPKTGESASLVALFASLTFFVAGLLMLRKKKVVRENK